MFCTHAQFFHFRRPLNCRPVNLSFCRPVTCNMAIYGVCILLRGSRGLAPRAFRCESKPTPLNLTYILPYDCPCFARMRNSFTSVDLSTVDLLTSRPVNMSTCQPFNLLTCQPVTSNIGVCIMLRESGVLVPRHSVVNQCLLH